MKLSLYLKHTSIIIFAGSFTLLTYHTFAQQGNPPVLTNQRSLGSSDNDQFRSMSLTDDGGCIVAGYSTADDGDVVSHLGQKDYWIVKLDSTLAIQWQQVLGGKGIDWARNVQPAADGGYLVIGYSNSTTGQVTGNHGGYDFWLVKLDHGGNLLWEKCLGGSLDDNGYTVLETNDGGYICSGYSFSTDADISGNHGLNDGWVVKLDADRNIQWQRSLGGTKSDEIDDVILTADGGYLLVGYSGSQNGDATFNNGEFDMWVVKLNANGNLEWEKSYGGSKDDVARRGIQIHDGGYIIAGFSASDDGDATINNGMLDFWILRIDSHGALIWQRSVGSSKTDYAFSIEATPDGNFLVTGFSGANDGDAIGNHGDSDAWTVKMDTLGNVLWQKNLGGSKEDVARSSGQLPDGSIIVAGFTHSSDGDVSGQHGGFDGWVAKLCFTSDFFADNDLDGYGNSLTYITACSAPPGYVPDNTDCNDNDNSIHPGATDLCDGIDNNCNGETDDNIFFPVIETEAATQFCEPGSVVLTAFPASSEYGFTWYKDDLLLIGNTSSNYTATVTGSYFVVITNGICTRETSGILITSHPLPAVSVNPSGIVNVCKVPVTLTVSGGEAYSYQWYKNNVLKPGATNATYTTNNTEAGDYNVNVTDINGCSSFSATTTVIRINAPAAIITPAGDLNICSAGSVKLQANSNTSFNYQWYRNSGAISGATKKTYTATTTGDYTVKVINASGCSKLSPLVAVYSSCREEEQVKTLTAEVYPNPASDIIHVSFQTAQPGVVMVKLCNVLGQQLQSYEVLAASAVGHLEIPLYKIREEGIYFITLHTAGEKVVRSFFYSK